jgi:hypothetical protein
MADLARLACVYAAGAGKFEYPFGIGKSKDCAAELRRFADDVEKGVILIQRIHCAQVSDIADYGMAYLFVEFVEARAVADAAPQDAPA